MTTELASVILAAIVVGGSILAAAFHVGQKVQKVDSNVAEVKTALDVHTDIEQQTFRRLDANVQAITVDIATVRRVQGETTEKWAWLEGHLGTKIGGG